MPVPGMMVHREIQIQLVDTPPITAEVMESWMPGLVQAADAALLVVDLAGEPLRSLEDVAARLGESNVHLKEGIVGGDGVRRNDKPTIVVGNKIDLPDAGDNLEVLQELYMGRFPIIAVSATEKSNLEAVAADTFRMLDLICIFTKEPGKKEPTGPPYALRRGSTILDLAREIHREFPEKLKSARVWGSAKFDGQIVDRHFVLGDGDTVELSVSA
jgi:ribosome-interacting GTPase 1